MKQRCIAVGVLKAVSYIWFYNTCVQYSGRVNIYNPLLFNNKFTYNFVQRNTQVITGIDYDTSEYICVTFKFVIFFSTLLTGSLEMMTVVSLLPHF
jgi:hypothetical protein